MMNSSSLSNDAQQVGENAGRRKENCEKLMRMKTSSRNGGVAAASAAAAAGASPDEFAKEEIPPPNIRKDEGKAVIVQPCATFPTSHLSFSHSIRIIVEQRRELRIDDPNENSQGAATTIVMTVDDNR